MPVTDQEAFSIPMSLRRPDGKPAQLWDPTKAGVTDPEPGAYAAKTTAVAVHEKEGKKSIKVTVELENGVATDLYLGLDFSKPSNQDKMMTALASVGLDVDALAKVEKFDFQPEYLLGPDKAGRPTFVIVKLVEGQDAKGRKKLNDKEFATAEQAVAYKAMLGTRQPAVAAAGAPPVSTPPATEEANAALKALFKK